MPRKDTIHDAVKNALIKDGWTITADPYTIRYELVILFADLEAEHPIAAEREDNRIVVEIKRFPSRSPFKDFQEAVGQYVVYRAFLRQINPDYRLYLAVSDRIYDRFLTRSEVQVVVEDVDLGFLVVNLDREEIIRWTR
jgi:hypothetical protein